MVADRPPEVITSENDRNARQPVKGHYRREEPSGRPPGLR